MNKAISTKDSKTLDKVAKILNEKPIEVRNTSAGVIVSFTKNNAIQRLTPKQLLDLSKSGIKWYESINSGKHTVGL